MANIQFSVEDLKTPERLEIVLRQFQSAITAPVPMAKLPPLSTLVSQIAPLISNELSASGSAPLNLQALLPSSVGSAVVAVGNHATRTTSTNTPPKAAGLLFYESDRTLLYISTQTAGSIVWAYAAGIADVLSSGLLTGLGSNDAGLLSWVSDYSHLLQWTGASWEWGPGEGGSGFYQMYESAPSGFGANAWQLCNGSTAPRFNSDGTTTSVTVPDVTTAVYLKGALAAAAITGASGGTPTGTISAPTFTGTPGTTGNDSASVEVQAGTGTTVAADPHTHAFTPAGAVSTPTFTGNAMSIELRNKTTALYYRR